jgi:hypothetical protein
MHPARFFLAPLMIVAAEMQNAMDQQDGKLFVERPASLSCLSLCGRDGNHDVAQWPGRKA